MVDFADSYIVLDSPADATPTTVAQVVVPGVADLRSVCAVSAWITLTLDALATALTLHLYRTSAGDPTVKMITYDVTGLAATPAGIPFVIEGTDAPGQFGEVGYALEIAVTDATGPSTVAAASMHARYNYVPLVSV